MASSALELVGVERFVTELDRPISVFDPQPASLGEVAWIHRARQGRDEYVEFHQPGLLWPVGHLASLITITERKFEPGPSGGVGAYLRQRRFVQVTQPVRDYRRSAAGFPYAGRELPYRTIRFASLVTPDLDRPPDGPGEVPPPFFPTIGGVPHHFDMATTDHTDTSAPLAARCCSCPSPPTARSPTRSPRPCRCGTARRQPGRWRPSPACRWRSRRWRTVTGRA